MKVSGISKPHPTRENHNAGNCISVNEVSDTCTTYYIKLTYVYFLQTCLSCFAIHYINVTIQRDTDILCYMFDMFIKSTHLLICKMYSAGISILITV